MLGLGLRESEASDDHDNIVSKPGRQQTQVLGLYGVSVGRLERRGNGGSPGSRARGFDSDPQ
jgi:hypothetical protein